MVIHDTECPYWDQVSLNNTKQKQTYLYIYMHISDGFVHKCIWTCPVQYSEMSPKPN